MSDTPFFRTVMGSRFFSHSVPEAIATMGRIANALERIAAALEAQGTAKLTATEGQRCGSRVAALERMKCVDDPSRAARGTAQLPPP
jgi:hypothetical protein